MLRLLLPVLAFAMLATPAAADPIITPLVAAGLGALVPEIAGIGGTLTVFGLSATSLVSGTLILGGLFGAEGLFSRRRP